MARFSYSDPIPTGFQLQVTGFNAAGDFVSDGPFTTLKDARIARNAMEAAGCESLYIAMERIEDEMVPAQG